MSIGPAGLPVTPLNYAVNTILGTGTAQAATVTLTAPTTATLITGMDTTVPVVIPVTAQFVKVTLFLPSVTISAAATITLGVYTDPSTAGTLTTLQQAQSFVSGTGATAFCGTYTFLIPVTAAGTSFPEIGSSVYVSVAATASTGNFVVNGTSTKVMNMIVEAF